MWRCLVGALIGGSLAFGLGFIAGGMVEQARWPGQGVRRGVLLGTLLAGSGGMVGALCGAIAELMVYLRRVLPEVPRAGPEGDYQEQPPVERRS